MVTQEIPAAQHTHEHPAHEGECEHEHPPGEPSHASGVANAPSGIGMQKVAEEESGKTGLEGSYHHAAMKEET